MVYWQRGRRIAFSVRASAWVVGLLLLESAFAPHLTWAVQRNYVGLDGGNWNVPANWSGNLVPVPADDAVLGTVNTGVTTNINVAFDANYAANLNSLTLDSTALTGTMFVNQTTPGTSMQALTAYIGKTVSLNVYNQSAGSNSIGTMYVGYTAAGSGTYNLSGSGSLIVSRLILGQDPGTTGVFNLNGGSLSNNNNLDETVGYRGHGTFNHTAGTNNLGGQNLILGDGGASSQGTYSLSNTGILSADSESLGNNFDSVGTFIQSGGSNTASFGVFVFGSTSGTCSYTLSGGSLNSPLLQVAAGGTFAQSGASTATIGNAFLAGTNSVGGSATFNATTLQVQLGGSFTQNGGTVNVSGNFNLNFTAFTQNGGNFNVNTANLGGGTYTQNGGTLNAITLNQSGTTVNGTLQNQGTFNYTSGVFNGRLLNQGVVNFNNDFTAGNGLENDATLNVYAGRVITLNGSGLDNEGTLNLYGGTLKMSTTSTNYNYGNFNLTNSAPLNLNGANLTNGGTVNLNGALVTGAGSRARR